MAQQSGVQGVFSVATVGNAYNAVHSYNQYYDTVQAYFTDGTTGKVQLQIIGKDAGGNIVFNEQPLIDNGGPSFKMTVPSNVMSIDCYLREVQEAGQLFLIDIFNS